MNFNEFRAYILAIHVIKWSQNWTFQNVFSGPNGKRGRKLAFGDANNFSLVAIEMTPSVDLKSDAVTQSSSQKETHARKMSLKFIFVTPRQLIEKEGREQKLSRVNLHLKTGSTFDLLGHKEDFRSVDISSKVAINCTK